MKLLVSTKDIIDSDKNSENVPRLENVEVILVHCNLVNNSYQQASRVLFTFVLFNIITEKNIYENIKENIKDTAELTTEPSALERIEEKSTTLSKSFKNLIIF